MSEQPKKLSLQEAMVERLKAKKQAQTKRPTGLQGTQTKQLTSQQTKKANNQKKRTGV
ncbi:hypothetical protein ACV3PA_03260 [Exiguobacterium acetylicum]|uniref:Uncharacterized protein n=1 Tax=Exiguobacterium acetylicum TaxID=41170 RepID=A0ABX8G8W7_EXIAC|nr:MULTISPECIES: hypothetical protein [Exiguobacterium]MCY1689620.1 hypothetical protein [Exiguobacterium sp. SL14]QWB30020.1 hypothetical protein KKI46_15805 [Exiguobacterium acetylicum]UKS55980.1 hypothetical protein K6T22_15870 [Exiguobacterium acetylicum]